MPQIRAQEPYTPVPDVTPTEQGLPTVHVDTPPAAFGANIGEAVKGLGGQMENVGNEMFQRAFWLQQLNNEADARNADAQYMIQSGQLGAKYSTLEGQDAVNAFPAHQQALESMRQNIRAGLNPMAQKMFDASSLSTLGHEIRTAQYHAATENKSFLDKSYDASIQVHQIAGGSHWDNDQLFDQDIQHIKDTASTKAIGKGWSDIETKAYTNDAVAKAWYNRIATMAITKPFEAKKLMTEHAAELGIYYRQLETTVIGHENTVGAKTAVDQITSGGSYDQRVIKHEGGVSATIQAPTSSATGYYQIVDKTWTAIRTAHPELNLPSTVAQADRDQQTAAFHALTADNAKILTQNGIETNQPNLYMAHFLGAKGAVRFIQGMKTDPGQPGTALASDAAVAANRSVFYNSDGTPRSAAQVYLHQTADFMGPGQLTANSGEDWLSAANKAGSDIANAYDPDNPGLKDAILTRLHTRWSVIRGAAMQSAKADLTYLQGFVNGGGDPKKAFNDPDQVLSNPMLNQVYQRLPPPMQNSIMSQIRTNGRISPPDTFERFQNFQAIMNKSLEINGQQQAFLDFDPGKAMEQGMITKAQRDKIYATQMAINKGIAQDNKHLTHAMSVSRDYLKSTNISAGSDEEIQFTGNMNQWLNDYVETNKHMPSDQEIRDHAADATTSIGHFWNSSYKFQPTSEFIDQFTPWFKNNPINRAHRDPTQEEIARAYQHHLTHPNFMTAGE